MNRNFRPSGTSKFSVSGSGADFVRSCFRPASILKQSKEERLAIPRDGWTTVGDQLEDSPMNIIQGGISTCGPVKVRDSQSA